MGGVDSRAAALRGGLIGSAAFAAQIEEAPRALAHAPHWRNAHEAAGQLRASLAGSKLQRAFATRRRRRER